MLSDILKTLYSSSGDIYEVLNRSRYITEIKKESDFVLLFHTGFRFRTHKGTSMDVYINLSNYEVVRSTQSPLPIKPPQLLGFIGAITTSRYLDRVFDHLCIHIHAAETNFPDPEDLLKGLGLVDYQNQDEVLQKGSYIPAIAILDAQGAPHTHSSFQIIEENGCVALPLRRTFGQPVYFDGKLFSEYDPSFHERLPSREEWLEEEFGDEAGTAYWNMD